MAREVSEPDGRGEMTLLAKQARARDYDEESGRCKDTRCKIQQKRTAAREKRDNEPGQEAKAGRPVVECTRLYDIRAQKVVVERVQHREKSAVDAVGIQELSGLTNEGIGCKISRYCWIGKARKGPIIKRKGAGMAFLVQD